MKKVILLGDSIKAWYAKRVRELLSGKCEDNLHHTPEGNEVLAQHVAAAILKKLNIE